MERPTLVVVGLGPYGAEHMTSAARDTLATASVARLRTGQHPAAANFASLETYDGLYESASSFEQLYLDIAEDLVRLARAADGPVVYAVPGSPLVAERTVELLRARDDVDLEVLPAVSVIDAACAALGRDPMSVGLRVLDGLDPDQWAGPGPLLILQAHSAGVLAVIADRLGADTEVTVLHHLGGDDEVVMTLRADELARFNRADHLTSLWVERLDTAGTEVERLVALTRTLRERCVWDREQTHASLMRHLLEEAYEALDALDRFVRSDRHDPSEVVEELGDVLFQIAFHCELGVEEGLFDLRDVASRVHDKLVSRHPHVFSDALVRDADEAAARWEELKRDEKGRASVTDGVPLDLPALTLYAKMRRKAISIGLTVRDGEALREHAARALTSIEVPATAVGDASADLVEGSWSELVASMCDLARHCGVDLEATLRRRALSVRDEIVRAEAGNRAE
jgi:tetrapyrrole methylase family protein/MazG family protein